MTHETDPATPDEPEALTVLHLEDNDLDARLIEEEMRAQGLRFDLLRTSGRDDFVRRLSARPIDLILSDFALPGYDGIAALTDARAALPEVPFLFVSGAIGEELAIDSLRRGATDYVLKDRLERLGPAVRRALSEARERRERRAASARAEALQARLYEAEREAREALSLLAHAGEVLAGSLEYEATLQNIAGLALPRLADYSVLDVLEADNAVRRIARASARAGALPQRAAMLQATSWARSGRAEMNLCALTTGRAALHVDIDDGWYQRAATTPEELALLRGLGFRSMITVPLPVQGRAAGALTLFFEDSGRRHSEGDLALATDLARRAAMALENAQLFRAARDASRLKDEFLATVSHELRTPMTAILGWSRLLPEHLDDADRLRQGLKVIERNARTQARLIDDVLDVSRIVTGTLRLEFERVDLAGVIRAALDAVSQAATAKGVDLRVAFDDGLDAIEGDPARLQQIVWNVAWNAVKFTPRGGAVTVTATRRDDAVRVRVTDSGQGISPEFLPHVFDRFRQADSTSTRRHGGLGLGLSIARHLVELHGGSIHAESPGEGLGATFTITLPTGSASVKAPGP